MLSLHAQCFATSCTSEPGPGWGLGGSPFPPLSCPGCGTPLLAAGRGDPGALRVACPFLSQRVHFGGQTGNTGLCPEPFPERAPERSPAGWEGEREASAAGCVCWLRGMDVTELGTSIYL